MLLLNEIYIYRFLDINIYISFKQYTYFIEIFYILLIHSLYRVATVRGKNLENKTFSRSWKSKGISFFSQENLEKNEKVMEKSGNYKNFQKSC